MENNINPNSFYSYDLVMCPYPPNVSNATFNVLKKFISPSIFEK